MALTFATLSVRNATSGGNFLMIVGLQMLAGSATLFPLSFMLESIYIDANPLWYAAFLYTTIFPGLVATLIWFWLMNRLGATRAATFHFLNPVFGVAIAALLLGEKLGAIDLIGVAIVTAGIFAVQTSRPSA
jgi:drug/metabolite transporter (DMT)-like permease